MDGMNNVPLIRDALPSILGLDEVSFFVAELIGFIGIAVITYGAVAASIHFLLATLYRHKSDLPWIRIEFGKHLALGLEFLVGKDIIESIVRPSWDDLGKLAALIALRTAVTFMLSKELKEIKEEIRDSVKYTEKKKNG